MPDEYCPRCGLWVPDNERTTYRGFHEDCVPLADPRIAVLQDASMRRINAEALERLETMPEAWRKDHG